MAQLVMIIDRVIFESTSLMPDGYINVQYTIKGWHWELVGTTPAEIEYFCSLMDNE